jgi:hypothetical protein
MKPNKKNSYQLTIEFILYFERTPVHTKVLNDVRAKEIKRAKEIHTYVTLIHQCLDDVYEHLVDREYQDFKDEVETAIEFLEYLRDNGDKKF